MTEACRTLRCLRRRCRRTSWRRSSRRTSGCLENISKIHLSICLFILLPDTYKYNDECGLRVDGARLWLTESISKFVSGARFTLNCSLCSMLKDFPPLRLSASMNALNVASSSSSFAPCDVRSASAASNLTRGERSCSHNIYSFIYLSVT